MKQKNKIYLQCGYEDMCRGKNCLECPRKNKHKPFNLTQAEETAIEDFAVCDLQAMIDEKPEEMDLLQNIMIKVMKKMFRTEKCECKNLLK